MGADLGALDLWRREAFGRAAVLSFTTSVVQAGFGFVTLILVGVTLSAETRGYFFTFTALTALFPLAEFGASYALMQTISHHGAHLDWGPRGLRALPEQLGLLTGMLRVAVVWNFVTTLSALCILALVGAWLFWAPASYLDLWWGWVGLLLCAALRQALTPYIALIEGSGRAADVWRFRLHQEFVGGSVLVISLALGAGLHAIAASWCARTLQAALWLAPANRRLASNEGPVDFGKAMAHWRSTVWPFQWRIGTSALAGFMTYYLFNPILLATRGPVEAGRFGMTLAITSAWQSATTAWIGSQAPRYGMLIAAGRTGELEADFNRTYLRSGTVSSLGWVLMVLCVLLSMQVAPEAAALVLSPIAFATLTGTAVVNHAISGIAVFVRAHRRDPFMLPSLIGALLTPVCTLWAARRGSTDLVTVVYLGLSIIGLLLAVLIRLRTRRAGWGENS